jgi:hypothetical protein
MQTVYTADNCRGCNNNTKKRYYLYYVFVVSRNVGLLSVRPLFLSQHRTEHAFMPSSKCQTSFWWWQPAKFRTNSAIIALSHIFRVLTEEMWQQYYCAPVQLGGENILQVWPQSASLRSGEQAQYWSCPTVITANMTINLNHTPYGPMAMENIQMLHMQ